MSARPVQINITPSSIGQGDFWDSPARHRLFLGGIGSGKTLAGAVALAQESIARPRSTAIVAAPTYKILRDAAQHTFLTLFGPIVAHHQENNNETRLVNGSRILWRSTDHPDALRGINASHAWLDEGAYAKEDAWHVLIGRLREGSGRAWITTTPRGRGWLYDLHVRQKIHTVHAKTADNQALDSSYVHELRARYSDRFAAQELDGEFVDWSGGLFKPEWFASCYVQPHAVPASLRWVRAWDVAFSARQSADETASVRAALDHATGTLYLAAPLAARLEGPDARALIVSTALAEGPRVPVGVEAVASQISVFQDLSRDTRLAAHALKPLRPQGDKVACAIPFASRAAAQRLALVGSPAEWSGWVEQWLAFPSAKHDDRVDAVSRALEMIAADEHEDVLAGFSRALRS